MAYQIRQNVGTHGTADSENLPIVIPTIFVVYVFHGLKHVSIGVRAVKLWCRYFTTGKTSVIYHYYVISFSCALLYEIPYVNRLRCASQTWDKENERLLFKTTSLAL